MVSARIPMVKRKTLESTRDLIINLYGSRLRIGWAFKNLWKVENDRVFIRIINRVTGNRKSFS